MRPTLKMDNRSVQTLQLGIELLGCCPPYAYLNSVSH